MARYIDAENIPTKFINFGMPTVICGIEVPDIDSAPTISPDEVRGVWEWVDKGVRAWSCSCCGTPLNHIRQFASFEKNELPNYCPNCGAKMEVSG